MRRWLDATAALVSLAGAAPAQHAAHDGTTGAAAARFTLGAMATALGTRAWPLVGGERVTEGYLTMPVIMAAARGAGGRLRLYAALDFEGATLRRGEVTPGSYGEGYVDRRHPHTWLHEAMVGFVSPGADVRWSLFGGKGFVPFGSDDPMMRPFVKYPVNHHLSQLLERAMLTVAVRARGVTLEGARFNGDEPEGTGDWPNADRHLDSWAARATYSPSPAVELTASAARVRSPEDAGGFGLDHRKEHAAVRFRRHAGVVRYALVELSRTGEYAGSERAYAFRSALAEGEAHFARGSVALRVERTDRPEEHRAGTPYRSIRPLLDFGILGITRWDVVTAQAAGRSVPLMRLRARPFVEAAHHRARARLRPTAIDPAEWYGSTRIWMLSAGVRLDAGAMRPRMGYYGSAP